MIGVRIWIYSTQIHSPNIGPSNRLLMKCLRIFRRNVNAMSYDVDYLRGRRIVCVCGGCAFHVFSSEIKMIKENFDTQSPSTLLPILRNQNIGFETNVNFVAHKAHSHI